MNYYTLYDLPEKPVVDKALVSKKYIALQRAFHPDYFTNETEEDKENALTQSADINKAYNIFSDTEKTIEYFLQLKGIILADEKFQLPPDFLMEMMELNEGFEEDKEIETKISVFENNLNENIKHLLALDNNNTIDENEIEKLKLFHYKKKYLKRILERLVD